MKINKEIIIFEDVCSFVNVVLFDILNVKNGLVDYKSSSLWKLLEWKEMLL